MGQNFFKKRGICYEALHKKNAVFDDHMLDDLRVTGIYGIRGPGERSVEDRAFKEIGHPDEGRHQDHQAEKRRQKSGLEEQQ